MLLLTQKQNVYILFLFLLFSSSTFSQICTISGYVSEYSSNEVLINASVYSNGGENLVYTNEYGYYSIQFQEGEEIVFTASYVGFKDSSIAFIVEKDMKIDFELTNISLSTIEVVAQSNPVDQSYLQKLNVESLIDLPTLGGEQDILKALTFYPGVSIGAEGTSELFVRGGTSDQNLYLLDQMPVYNVTHLGGFLSVFNADAMQNVSFYKSGFPAKYSGRLSSVVDISLKEGNKNTFGGKYSIGILTSKLLLEGPITKKKNSSFLLAARSSYLGLINLFRNKEQTDNFLNYWLYDINAKANFSTKRGNFFISYYTGLDNGSSISKSQSTSLNRVLNSSSLNLNVFWGNQTLTSRYTSTIGKNLFLKAAIGYTSYFYNSNEESVIELFVNENRTNLETESSSIKSKINSIIGRIDLDFNQNNKMTWTGGIYSELQNHSINNFVESVEENSGFYLDFYLDNTVRSNNISFISGIRYSNYLVDQQNLNKVQPRFEVVYDFENNSNLVLNYSRMVQYLHQLTLNNFGIFVNTWLNSSERLKPQTSDQISLAANFRKEKLKSATLEVFYKKQNNLVEYKDNDPELIAVSRENTIELISTGGQGEIYGAELYFLADPADKFSISGAYTLSWNYRQFDDLNNGERYLFNFDRRHDFSLNSSLVLSEKWSINSTFAYQSGSRFSGPVANIKIPGTDFPFDVFGERNNIVLPDYHRLDISIKYNKENKVGNNSTWNFTIYNLYNRANVNNAFINGKPVFDENGQFLNTKPSLQFSSNFGLIPSLSYELQF